MDAREIRRAYIDAASKGLLALTRVILDRERKTLPATVLRSFYSTEEAENTVRCVLASIPRMILEPLIRGNLAKAKHESAEVKLAVDHMTTHQAEDRPVVYYLALVDVDGNSPSGEMVLEMLSLFDLYIQVCELQSPYIGSQGPQTHLLTSLVWKSVSNLCVCSGEAHGYRCCSDLYHGLNCLPK